MSQLAVGTADDDAALGVACVRALLERHGLARHKHSPVVSEILGLSYSQSHRKMTGTTPWLLEELVRVARHFGEPLSALLEAGTGEVAQAGVLVAGGLRLPCRVWLTDSPPGPHATLVAQHRHGQWWVMAPGETVPGSGTQALQGVRRLVIEASPAPTRHVAVLDDDRDVADSLAAQLSEAGLQAQAFYTVAALQAAMQAQRFDGFVIDWLLGGTTALAVIEAIRAQDAQCPIAVLTGQLLSRQADESEVARALQRFALLFYEKPVRAFIVAAAMMQAMEGQGP